MTLSLRQEGVAAIRTPACFFQKKSTEDRVYDDGRKSLPYMKMRPEVPVFVRKTRKSLRNRGEAPLWLFELFFFVLPPLPTD